LGINFANGSSTGVVAYDQDGGLSSSDSVTGSWHKRCVDLTPYAPSTIGAVWIGAGNLTPAGTWDMYFGDISITSSDGTVTPIYSRYKSIGLDLWINRTGPTNLQAFAETSNSTADSVQGLETTTYYHGDQIGSARMVTSGGGWPVSSDTFYPFGQEQTATADPNHYKFTGQERDSESNLDYFKARHYSFTAGRFMSPDPYSGSMDPSNPQSFNRYPYVGNMPLGYKDPTGLFGEEIFTIVGPGTSLCLKICAWAGPVGWAAAGVTGLLELTHILGLWGQPAFHGSLQPRPANPNSCSVGPDGKKVTGPPGSSVYQNARALNRAATIAKIPGAWAQSAVFATWVGLVTPHSVWDFKNGVTDPSTYQQYADYGNYNYGATCSALGLGPGTCGDAAGQATRLTNGGSLEGEGGINQYPYGDQSRDAQFVKKGYDDYQNGRICP
jgi:RHS repeat-associated protein